MSIGQYLTGVTYLEKEVSCRVIGTLIRGLETMGFDIRSLWEGLPYSREYLVDPSNWTSRETAAIIADRAAALTSDPKIMYRIGIAMPTLRHIAAIEHMARFFINPRVAYGSITRWAALLDRQLTFQVEIVNQNNALIRMSQNNIQTPSMHTCYFTQGLLSALPKWWKLPTAEVTELDCMCRSVDPESTGDDSYRSGSCLYKVTWQPSNSTLERVKNRLFVKTAETSNPVEAIEKNYQMLGRKNTELMLRNRQLNKVREIALSIDTVRDMDQTLSLVVELARDIPGVRFVMMQKLDPTSQNIVIPYYSKIRSVKDVVNLKTIGFDVEKVFGSSPDSQKLDFPLGKIKIAQDYYANPRMIVINRISDLLTDVWPDVLCDSVQNILQVKKLVSVPVFVDNSVWGNILFLLDGEVSPDILQMVGTHCSIAIKNVLTLERLEKRNHELSALHSISTRAARSPDIESIIGEITKEIAGIFSADGVVIFRMQESSNQLQMVGQTGLSDAIKKHMEPPLSSEFVNFLSSGESLTSGNMNDFTIRYPDVAPERIRALPWFMTAALDINGRRSGTISVVRYQENDFLPNEKSLLTAISNQLSLSFENTRLHRNLVQRVQDLETTRNLLTQSEEKMNLTIDSLSEGIMITSLDGRIIQANEPAARIHGYTSNDHFVGTHSLRYVDLADRRKMLENLKIIQETGNAKIAEYTLIKKDNSRFLTECNISIYKDFLGKPGGFVICIRDISERRQAEKRLQDSERKYRLIAENTNDYIAMLSFSGYYSYVSPSYRQLGYEPGELAGKSGLNLIHPDDQKAVLPLLLKFSQMDAADLNRMRSSNYTQRLEYRIKDKAGGWHYLFTTGNVIESLDGRGFNILLISHDVTDLKRAEEELKQSYNSEKEARRALELEISKRADFFRALVHELKTPLTPIMVSSEALIDLISEPTFKNLARNVYNGASRLNERVDELLDIARGERGMLKVNCEPMSMEMLIRDVANFVRPQTTQNRQGLQVDIPAPLPAIMGDETRLRQVILNLLDNAMKFTPERGQITLRAIADDENLMVKVQDTGCGIDTSDQERLFQPYNRIEDDRQHFSGLGLGLALCKQLIDLHGGRLWIESQKGKGTSFFFSLPTAKPADLKSSPDLQSRPDLQTRPAQQVNPQSMNQS